MRLAVPTFAALALVSLAGCGGTVALPIEAAGTGGAGGSAPHGSATTGSVTPGTTTTGGGGTAPFSTTDGAPPAETCTSNSTCPDGAFCDFQDGSCGANGAVGTCTPTSDGAGGPLMPVCGCDGMTYDNAAFAAFYGVSVKSQGPCQPFACGPLTCDPTTQYCANSPDIQQPAPPQYSCQPLPTGCGVNPSCDCLDNICGSCSGEPATGLTKYCPGEG